MRNSPRAGPQPVRDVPVFAKARAALVTVVADAIDGHPWCYYLWLLALEEIDRAAGGNATVPLADVLERAVLHWLRDAVQREGTSALEVLVAELRTLHPAEAAVFGGALHATLTDLGRVALGRPPLRPGLLEVEQLSPTNPLRVVAYTADHMLVAVPYQMFADAETTGTHLLELASYGSAWRHPRPRGRPPSSHDTPNTRHPSTTDAEARRAWTLHREGATRDQIAQALWPQTPMITEQDRRRVRAAVTRRLARGRVLASDAPPRA